jgi:hypothetical protein
MLAVDSGKHVSELHCMLVKLQIVLPQILFSMPSNVINPQCLDDNSFSFFSTGGH